MAIPGRLNITAGCVTISMIIPAYSGRSPTHWIYLGRPQGNLSIQRRCGLLPTSHGRVSPTLLTLPITSLRTLRASLTLPRPERPERPQVLERFFWCLASGRLSRNLRPRPAARPRLTLRTQRTERTQNLETLDGYLALAATFPESPSASVRVSASLP